LSVSSTTPVGPYTSVISEMTTVVSDVGSSVVTFVFYLCFFS
jgi:hypothetical protein